ncbi:hypothetical protein [Tenacibaculum sp. C7A-26P2]|uniref:hypothetical protein n=1 Tax=Tenacibaculum sp. C7A-26P2 TaxID=3447504 RepID=UPI003F84C4D5
MSITIEQAEKAITKAKQNSILINTKMNITIVGTEANLDTLKTWIHLKRWTVLG